jgi:hypothetical protein
VSRFMLRSILLVTFLVLTSLSTLGQSPNSNDPSPKPLVNQDIIRMVSAKFADSTIIKAIQANDANFDVSATALLELKNSGVSQAVIEEMLSVSATKKEPKADVAPPPQPQVASVTSTSRLPDKLTSQQPCPIEIQKIDPTAVIFGTSDPWGWELSIAYKNVSSQDIVGIKFGVNYIDATGDRQSAFVNYISDDRVKPGAIRKEHWHDGVHVNELGLRLGAEAWPIKVTFANGTSWEDNQTHMCGAKRGNLIKK